MEDRFDLEHGTHHSGGGRDASAPLQEVEVVHREVVAQVLLVCLYPVPDLFNTGAVVPLLGGIPHQQALSQRGAQGIHSVQFAFRVFFSQLLHRNQGGVVGGGQSGGEGQHQYVLPRLKQGFQRLGILGNIDGVGGGRIALAQAVVEGVRVHLPVVRVVVIGMIR